MTTRPVRALLVLVALAACERSPRSNAAASAYLPPAAAPVADTTSPTGVESARVLVGGVAGDSAAESETTEAIPARSAPSTAEDTPLTSPFASQDIQPGSMLVRIGTASLQVDSLEVGITRVRDLARRSGAIVANTTMEGGRQQTRAASLQLRIPSEHFDDAVAALGPIGKLESVNVNVQDVGEEYVDVQARLANARRLEARLVDLLARRTGKLSDVLAVERELARVREEIERYEGRMHYLRSRASVSTLTISIHEPYPIVAERPGARPIRDAFVQAWRNFVGFVAGCIEALGVLVPLAAILVILVLIGRRVIPNLIARVAASRTTAESGGA